MWRRWKLSSGVLDLPDFYFTGDDYRYRFEPEAKQRFLGLLRERFNTRIRCNGRGLKWDTAIEQKATELGKYLTGKIRTVDFSDISPKLMRLDDHELRAKILSMTQSEAGKLGIGRSTLHNLRYNARRGGSLRVSRKVIARLQ
jgi:CRISPR-associated protein Cas1